MTSANLPPPNNRKCQRAGCSRKAAGFVTFEAKMRGITNVLPFEWRCQEHANLAACENWSRIAREARDEFERRDPSGTKVEMLLAGLSTLDEEDADDLVFFVRGALPTVERYAGTDEIDVELVRPGDLVDAFGEKVPRRETWDEMRARIVGEESGRKQ